MVILLIYPPAISTGSMNTSCLRSNRISAASEARRPTIIVRSATPD
jgi:hypothetical protein